MSNPTTRTFEVILVYSHLVEGERQHLGWKKSFEQRPNDIQIAAMIADKHAAIEADELVDPQYHELGLRTVDTEKLDLSALVEDFNDTYYPETETDDGN